MEELWRGVAALCGLAIPFAFYVLLLLPSGLPRLLALFPFLVSFLALPRLLPSTNARGVLALPLCWYCPFKLLLLCFDRFVDWPAWTLSSFPHFALAILLPIRVKGTSCPNSTNTYKHLLSLVGFILAIVCFLNLYYLLPEAIMRPAVVLLNYPAMSIPQIGAAIFLQALFHVDLHPVFNKPWLSTSLTEFWGNRWNITASAILRQTVYNPVLQLLSTVSDGRESSTKKPKLLARVAAVLTTFLVSGLMHELVYMCISQAKHPTWEVTVFHVLNGMATSIEIIVRRICSPHNAIFKLPRSLKLLWTLGFVYATGTWLLVAHLVSSHVYLQASMECVRFETWMVAAT